MLKDILNEREFFDNSDQDKFWLNERDRNMVSWLKLLQRMKLLEIIMNNFFFTQCFKIF